MSHIFLIRIKEITVFFVSERQKYFSHFVVLPYKNAAIRLSADGKYLYVSLREENGICVYQVNGKNLTLLQQTNCGGDSPRDFDICGDYLIVCNENSENVVVYRIANRLIINKVAEISIKRALCVVK